jgi:DNA primase
VLLFPHRQEVRACPETSGAAREREEAMEGQNEAGQTQKEDAPSPETTAGLLERVVEFYHKTIFKSGRALRYMRQQGLDASSQLLKPFRIGFASGRLVEILPREGGTKVLLRAEGVLTDADKELLANSIVFPVNDAEGRLLSLHGFNVEELKPVNLPTMPTALWNIAAARIHNQIIITGSALDSLGLVTGGYVNTCALINDTIRAHDITVLQQLGVKQIVLAGTSRFMEDARGQLPMFEIRLVVFEKGVCAYLAAHGPQALADYMHQAQNASAEAQLPDGSVRHIDSGFCVQFGRRRYEVRGLEKSPHKLKTTIRVERAGSAPGDKMHIDTLDFYAAKSRRTLAQDLCCLFEETPAAIDSDINRLVKLCEEFKPKDIPEGGTMVELQMTAKERQEAEGFGKSPDLKEKILQDFDACGLVGEVSNKFLCYLAAVSRKMDDPVSVLILSSSGAGKTKLQDTTLLLCPPEDVIKLTSLSGKALFYKGRKSLKHKILALAEEAGAEEAAYAIRNLISAGELIIEVTVKDLGTGKMTTMENRVEGPTAVFITTTNPDVDPETRSRFFVTSIDESREQTRAILTFQRRRHTLAGRTGHVTRDALIEKHRNFQRLLKPVMVVNPYAEKLVYSDDRLQSRRDQPKYLNLINAVAFLRQMQKEVRRFKVNDSEVDGIEVDEEDMRLANEVASDVLGRSLDDLNSVSRDLLDLIDTMVCERVRELKDEKTGKPAERRDVVFSRRDIREYTGWPHARVQRYLRQLLDLEFLLTVSGRNGSRYSYQLAYDGQSSGRDKSQQNLITPYQGLSEPYHPGNRGQVVGQQ